MPTFLALMCKFCGKWNAREILHMNYKGCLCCKYCSKQSKIKDKRSYGLSLRHRGPFPTGSGCAKAVSILNDKR